MKVPLQMNQVSCTLCSWSNGQTRPELVTSKTLVFVHFQIQNRELRCNLSWSI